MKLALLLIPLALCGCSHRLPNIKAAEIHTRTNVMGVTTTVEASGIVVSETKIKATDAKWTIGFPGFDHTTTAKDFEQKIPKENEPIR